MLGLQQHRESLETLRRHIRDERADGNSSKAVPLLSSIGILLELKELSTLLPLLIDTYCMGMSMPQFLELTIDHAEDEEQSGAFIRVLEVLAQHGRTYLPNLRKVKVGKSILCTEYPPKFVKLGKMFIDADIGFQIDVESIGIERPVSDVMEEDEEGDKEEKGEEEEEGDAMEL